MLRLVDMESRVTTGIRFSTEELTAADLVPYVIYDTSTGASYLQGLVEDYYAWRTVTVTSTGSTTDCYFDINNTNLYPSFTGALPDYTVLKPSLFKVVSYQEYAILQAVLARLDLVRRRYPNPGFAINSTNNIGQDGNVSFAGGFEKKLSIDELMTMIMGTIVEINATSPTTSFWPAFMSSSADKFTNPYNSVVGLPWNMLELVTLGVLIRGMYSIGMLEIDINFSASESGLQLTFDRDAKIKSWQDSMLQDYTKTKMEFKMEYVPNGYGVGTFGGAGLGVYGSLWNMASSGGSLAMSSLGFSRANVPL